MKSFPCFHAPVLPQIMPRLKCLNLTKIDFFEGLIPATAAIVIREFIPASMRPLTLWCEVFGIFSCVRASFEIFQLLKLWKIEKRNPRLIVHVIVALFFRLK